MPVLLLKYSPVDLQRKLSRNKFLQIYTTYARTKFRVVDHGNVAYQSTKSVATMYTLSVAPGYCYTECVQTGHTNVGEL